MGLTTEYIGLGIVLFLSAGIAGLMFGLNALLGPKPPKTSRVKYEPFECGMTPFEIQTGRAPVKFYLVAMLFILFDVEIIWFFPWAVILKELKWAGLIEMFIFIGVLAIGYMYAWRKGALEWGK